MTEPHSHDLDGKLHDDCAMCDLIRSRQVGAQRDANAKSALDRHRQVAEKSRIGREVLKKDARK